MFWSPFRAVRVGWPVGDSVRTGLCQHLWDHNNECRTFRAMEMESSWTLWMRQIPQVLLQSVHLGPLHRNWVPCFVPLNTHNAPLRNEWINLKPICVQMMRPYFRIISHDAVRFSLSSDSSNRGGRAHAASKCTEQSRCDIWHVFACYRDHNTSCR